MKYTDGRILALFCLLFVVLYLIYYPVFYIEGDDQVYLRTTYRLLEGHGYNYEKSEELYAYSNLAYYNPVKNDYYFPFNPLTPIILLPFLALGFHFVFFAPLLFHLTGFFIFYLILKELDIDPKGSILYLFFPAMLFLSRTLLSDVFIIPFLLASFLLYIKEKHLFASVLLGVAYLIRGEALMFIGVYAVCLLYRKKYQQAVKMTLPFFVFFVALLLINYSQFGSITNPDYGGKFVRNFLEGENHNVLQNIVNYTLALNIIRVPGKPDNLFFMPLMFLPLLLYKKRGRLEIFLLTASAIVFHAVLLEGGFLKYIIPVSLFLLIPYLDNIKRLSQHRQEFFSILVVAFVFFAFALSIRYFTVSTQKFIPSHVMYSNIPANFTVIANASDGMFFYLHEGMGNLTYLPLNENNSLPIVPSDYGRLAYVQYCFAGDGDVPDEELKYLDVVLLNASDFSDPLTMNVIPCPVLNFTLF